MKIFKLYPLLLSALFLIVVTSCNEEERDTSFVNGIAAPTNVSLNVVLTQDNSGLTTLTPTAESASIFTINFGDDTEEVTVLPGESTIHNYAEGIYTATVTAANLNGDVASITQEIVVSFLPPENLEINISQVSGDAFSIDLSATADFAIGFDVFFGDENNNISTPLMVGETIQHTYVTTGTFIVRVVALAGGAATLEATQEVLIENPITLPIDFESTTIDYAFTDFGGAITTVIDNPDATGNNTSNTVAQFFKESGAEVFAGTIIELGAPINFTDLQGFSLNSWSPIVGATVKLKLENGIDNTISAEIDATTTVANSWETLQFDFSGQDLTQEYSKVIVFFDFDQPGAGTTFFFDDIEQSTGMTMSGDPVALPLTFEDSSLAYDIIGFEGADSVIESNPFVTGENTSATVLRTTKTMGAQFFAGTVVNLDTPIDFSVSEMLSFKSYSPKSGIPVKLRIENADNSVGVEVDMNTTIVDQWETLTYDFSGLTAETDFVRVVVFFEFVVDLPGDGSTYYFDDVQIAN